VPGAEWFCFARRIVRQVVRLPFYFRGFFSDIPTM
jgi:hypothetical protein